MKNLKIFLMLSFLFSCNFFSSSKELNNDDIKYIQGLGLLDQNEKIYKFYSEYKKRNAGNFFTEKRIATYWVDDRDKTKDVATYALYPNVSSMDTVYDAGATYSPYILVTKVDGTQFKVSAGGKKEEVKLFFEGAIEQWQKHK